MARRMEMTESCRLCRNIRQLRNSHIIPEFLYKPTYNRKGHAMGIHGRGNRGWKSLQKGLRDPLFCEQCEQHFNAYCEQPFYKQWIAAAHLPDPWPAGNHIHWVTVDYSSFKLFHLSVLFRASVSQKPTFVEVSLGPHEEKLRQLILSKDPAEPYRYPIFGIVVVHPSTWCIENRIVSRPVQSSHDGHRCYGTMYGGVNGG